MKLWLCEEKLVSGIIQYGACDVSFIALLQSAIPLLLFLNGPLNPKFTIDFFVAFICVLQSISFIFFQRFHYIYSLWKAKIICWLVAREIKKAKSWVVWSMVICLKFPMDCIYHWMRGIIPWVWTNWADRLIEKILCGCSQISLLHYSLDYYLCPYILVYLSWR